MKKGEEAGGGGGRLGREEAEVTVITSVFPGSRSSGFADEDEAQNEPPPCCVTGEPDLGRVSLQRGGQSCEQG